MTVHYCDRCKREAEKLIHHRIPDESKCHSYDSYSVKEVELCQRCEKIITNAERTFLLRVMEMKFAFYKALMQESEDTE